MDFGLRRAARRHRAERRRLGADRIRRAPPPQHRRAPVNPMCPRLEAQLATIDRGGSGDPAKDDQIRRYQDAATKQQGELDRVTSQAKRMGCDSSGFFSLFSGQSAQCGPVNNQIQQMRANLDQITTSLERLRGGGFGGPDRDNQRRSVLIALAQNNCGPQYAACCARPAAAISSTTCSATTTIRTRPAPISVRSPAPIARSACAPATASISRSRSPPCRRAFPTTRRPARPLPGGGSHAVRLSQSRRRHQPGGVDQRPALFVVAERVQIPHRIQSVLRLQGRRTDLVRRAEEHRRQGRRRTAGRHHRHRRERQEDVAARRQPKRRPLRPRRALQRPPTTAARTAAAASDCCASACRRCHRRRAGDKPIRSVGPTFIPAR